MLQALLMGVSICGTLITSTRMVIKWLFGTREHSRCVHSRPRHGLQPHTAQGNSRPQPHTAQPTAG